MRLDLLIRSQQCQVFFAEYMLLSEPYLSSQFIPFFVGVRVFQKINGKRRLSGYLPGLPRPASLSTTNCRFHSISTAQVCLLSSPKKCYESCTFTTGFSARFSSMVAYNRPDPAPAFRGTKILTTCAFTVSPITVPVLSACSSSGNMVQPKIPRTPQDHLVAAGCEYIPLYSFLSIQPHIEINSLKASIRPLKSWMWASCNDARSILYLFSVPKFRVVTASGFQFLRKLLAMPYATTRLWHLPTIAYLPIHYRGWKFTKFPVWFVCCCKLKLFSYAAQVRFSAYSWIGYLHIPARSKSATDFRAGHELCWAVCDNQYSLS